MIGQGLAHDEINLTLIYATLDAFWGVINIYVYIYIYIYIYVVMVAAKWKMEVFNKFLYHDNLLGMLCCSRCWACSDSLVMCARDGILQEKETIAALTGLIFVFLLLPHNICPLFPAPGSILSIH